MSEEIKKLIEGNKQFRNNYFNKNNTVFDDLVLHGQKPKIMIIACSDSRIDPAIIFNSQPGELFVVRNVANLVPPFEESGEYHGTSAALEFGICFLEVEHIIVLGHTQCGGIQALLQSAENVLDKKNRFIAKWMELAGPAYKKLIAENGKVPFEEKVTLCEQYALINSLKNLHTFPWIQERINNNKLLLHAWYFDLASGIINMYDQKQDNWHILEE